jgi:hypothetical protein
MSSPCLVARSNRAQAEASGRSRPKAMRLSRSSVVLLGCRAEARCRRHRRAPSSAVPRDSWGRWLFGGSVFSPQAEDHARRNVHIVAGGNGKRPRAGLRACRGGAC